jgi:hypothetical protein
MSFITSRGLLHSCDSYQRIVFSSNPRITEDILKDIADNSTVYICTTAIPAFVKDYLPRLKTSITLVTGDADESVKTTNVHCATLLASPFIKRWFAQNCLSSHPKLIHMPIGLAYHAMAARASEWGPRQSEAEQELDIVNLRSKMKPFYERIPRCYSTFHFFLDRGDRREAYKAVPKELVYYEPHIVHRIDSFLTQTQYAFVLSPAGGGPDCHRTWEALAMGCIPIVKTSGMDPLFEGLPVLIVKVWSDITQELLNATILSFRDRTFSYEKLTLDYWRLLFDSTADAEIRV